MVGHTGFLEPTVQAVAAVDLSLGRLIPVVHRLGGAMIVTADHGNVDEMFLRDKAGQPILGADGRPRPKTSHTLSPVPLHVYAPGTTLALDASVKHPGLANLAATCLTLLGLSRPDGYEPSLIR
jgi:2,3-bisphosphoglycerate-independent phosphoglycerate mutase